MSLKFKKVEVSGFKSFADKLEIKFGGGITGIVGPNGCGKSNVADSIRWVLGEQSAKLLRGSSMQDVIFKGTESRKSLSFCEVSLYFDNTEKWFSDLPYDEVVISRKLYRSGESEYYINKQPCRLRDITEYLRDAGMGREGYSIIGQGRVESLLSAKPEERRAIFEEAAGISKFKAKKTEAERKLVRTRDNLTRINDILAEKLNILEPLTKQAESARKYLELQEQLRKSEINSYIYQYESAAAAKDVISERLNKLLSDIAVKDKECEEAVAAYNEAFQNFTQIDTNISGLRTEMLSLTRDIGKKDGDVKVLNERIKYMSTQSERLIAEGETLTRQQHDVEEKVAFGKSELEKKEYELTVKREKNGRLSDEYFKLVDEVNKHEAQLDINRKEMLDAMDKLTEIKSNMSSLIAERTTLSNLIEEISAKLSESENNLSSVRESIVSESADKAALTGLKNELQKEFDELRELANECAEKVGELSPRIESLNEKFHVARSRRKILKDLCDAYNGYTNSVRNLLTDGKKDAEIGSKILGVVGQLLKVDPQFETAVEMALGSAVQNVVVATEDDAKYLISYLKEKRYGRVTFLPISSVKPRNIDRAYIGMLSANGIFGVASELVSYAPEFKTVVEGLLGSTVLADNMDTAVKLARSTGFSFKIVTLDGDVINPSGSMTGGSKKAEVANIFSQDRELQESTVLVDKYEKELSELTAERKAVVQKQQETSEKLRVCRERLHECEVTLARRAEGLNKLKADEAMLDEQCIAYRADTARHKARVDEIDADINSVGALENTIEEKKKISSDNSQEKRHRFDELKKQRDKYAQDLSDSRLEIAKTESIINALRSEIERLENNAVVIADNLKRGKEQIAANTVSIQGLNEQLAALTGPEHAEDASRAEYIQARLANLDEYKAEIQGKMTDMDADRNRLRDELLQLRERKTVEEMQLLKVDTDIEQMQQHIMEAYGYGYEQCLEFKQPDFNPEKGTAEINRLKRQIKSLGYVNVQAIEQSKTMYEEYHKMDVQRDDLQKAEADLLSIIKEIGDEMIGRFNDRFAQIRENFIKIFRELFDGGTADLVILESDDPLEAGIEIIAQPPEKKLQSISLLSGGERALTAIAILFAILRLKPMPFCVLDEIEAALDDANAGRFARYLRRFSEETQFIVITHRKPTMELADSLYGVTMEEKGVSKIVSVKLSDAVAAAESM